MSSYLSKIKSHVNKKKASLQVRSCDNNQNGKGTCLKASLTLEAALVLPLILFCMILLMMPLQMMNADRKVQAVCEDVASDVSKYLYTVNEIKRGRLGSDGSSGSRGSDSRLSTIMEIADGPALGAYAAMRIKSEVADDRLKIVNLLNSELDSRDDMVTVRIEYAYKLPFKVFDLGFLQQEVTASRRAWVGADGSADEGAEVADDEWVYIGKNATRYHLSASCHYLYNDWKRAVVGANGKAAGKRPCEICGGSAAPGQTVYITPNGDKYHTDTGCPAMKAYPKMVRKSEVEHLGCCSYCQKHYAKKEE